MRTKRFFKMVTILEVGWKRSPQPFFFADGSSCGLMYAEKDGGPVLKDESSWRKINGVFINLRRWDFYCYVLFRRFGP